MELRYINQLHKIYKLARWLHIVMCYIDASRWIQGLIQETGTVLIFKANKDVYTLFIDMFDITITFHLE